MSSAGWVEAFLEMMAVERAAARNTLTAYGRDLADARDFLKSQGTDLDRTGAEQVEAYFLDLGVRGLSSATASRRRAAVRQFYRFVLGEGWRDALTRSASARRPSPPTRAWCACSSGPRRARRASGRRRRGAAALPQARLLLLCLLGRRLARQG